MRAAILLLAVLASTAHAQPAPPALEAARVDEKPGAQVPLATNFTGVREGYVQLGQVIDGTKPVLLVLAYARCTMLCSLLLRGVTEVARSMPLVAGRDYQLVLVGLDARETIDEARRKHASLAADLGKGDWTYLVGQRDAIDAVARALGFRYAWDARTEQFAHPAVVFALTPDGRVARYLHGVQFDADDLVLALDDAREGRIMSSVAVEALRCFRFDPASRRDGAAALAWMRVGAGLMFITLVMMIVILVRAERRREGES